MNSFLNGSVPSNFEMTWRAMTKYVEHLMLERKNYTLERIYNIVGYIMYDLKKITF